VSNRLDLDSLSKLTWRIYYQLNNKCNFGRKLFYEMLWNTINNRIQSSEFQKL